jgi:acetyl/propionyl-CoA carboxylase alpha subunit
MIAKLITHGRTWEETVARTKIALQAFKIGGVKTIIPWYIQVMDDEDFKRGNFDIRYVPEHPHLLDYEEQGENEDHMALLAAAIAAYHRP